MKRSPDAMTLNATAVGVVLAASLAIGLVGYAIVTGVHLLSSAVIAQDMVRLAH